MPRTLRITAVVAVILAVLAVVLVVLVLPGSDSSDRREAHYKGFYDAAVTSSYKPEGPAESYDSGFDTGKSYAHTDEVLTVSPWSTDDYEDGYNRGYADGRDDLADAESRYYGYYDYYDADLDAEVADLAKYLRHDTVPPGYSSVREALVVYADEVEQMRGHKTFHLISKRLTGRRITDGYYTYKLKLVKTSSGKKVQSTIVGG
jgi:hypothetical protein